MTWWNSKAATWLLVIAAIAVAVLGVRQVRKDSWIF